MYNVQLFRTLPIARGSAAYEAHCRAPHRRHSAVRLIGGIPRTGHLSGYMLDVLHWLPLQQRIIFRIGAMVWRCILGLDPAYLRDLCHPTPGTR